MRGRSSHRWARRRGLQKQQRLAVALSPGWIHNADATEVTHSHAGLSFRPTDITCTAAASYRLLRPSSSNALLPTYLPHTHRC